jgi:hypothetical protein
VAAYVSYNETKKGENLLIGIESLGFRLESELEIISPVACNDGVATDPYIKKLYLSVD